MSKQLKKMFCLVFWVLLSCLFAGCQQEKDHGVNSGKTQEEVFQAEAVAWHNRVFFTGWRYGEP